MIASPPSITTPSEKQAQSPNVNGVVPKNVTKTAINSSAGPIKLAEKILAKKENRLSAIGKTKSSNIVTETTVKIV